MTDADPLDQTDRRIVATVQQDGRISLTDLALAVHLGLSATRIRLQRLHERGVITSYSARVDPRALGYPIRALARLRVTGAQDRRVIAVVADTPAIVRCLRVTGDICYVIEIVATDVSDLERTTAKLVPLGELTTDLVYDVLADKPVPSTTS